MNTELSLMHLFLNASLVVKLVMLLLLAASLYAWTIIIQKWRLLRSARADAEVFEKRFWSGIDLVDLYKQVAKRRDEAAGMERLFEAGFREYVRLRKQPSAGPATVIDGAQRGMRITLSREVDRLDSSLAYLATVGSTSPYVGLFGTVWGIMNSFQALGGAQHATLSMVAPGIAEALIATAMGLFAAIPAVIAYNRYASDVERLVSRYDAFLEEFSAILQRQVHAEATVD